MKLNYMSIKSRRGCVELAFIYCLAVSIGASIVALRSHEIAKKCSVGYCKIYSHEYRDTMHGRECWICGEKYKVELDFDCDANPCIYEEVGNTGKFACKNCCEYKKEIITSGNQN